jgi:hypothetical protein
MRIMRTMRTRGRSIDYEELCHMGLNTDSKSNGRSKITVSTSDGNYAGYIVRADMRIRGRSIDFEEVREIDINMNHKSNGTSGRRHGTVTLGNGTYLNYEKDEIEGSLTITVPGIEGELTFNWNDDKVMRINNNWW